MIIILSKIDQCNYVPTLPYFYLLKIIIFKYKKYFILKKSLKCFTENIFTLFDQ